MAITTPSRTEGKFARMPLLVLVRHGESIWNAEDRFTGWIDVPLSPNGESEAHRAAELLEGYEFHVAYTSALMRAQETLRIMMEDMRLDVPVIRDQALNERFYGDLQGLNKQRTRERYGDEQVLLWRRSYDIAPPGGESLEMTAKRTMPFFERAILGDISQGKNVLVVAHGNSNRSIIMGVENIGREDIVSLNLDTGTPYVYELDTDGKMTGKRVLK